MKKITGKNIFKGTILRLSAGEFLCYTAIMQFAEAGSVCGKHLLRFQSVHCDGLSQ